MRDVFDFLAVCWSTGTLLRSVCALVIVPALAWLAVRIIAPRIIRLEHDPGWQAPLAAAAAAIPGALFVLLAVEAMAGGIQAACLATLVGRVLFVELLPLPATDLVAVYRRAREIAADRHALQHAKPDDLAGALLTFAKSRTVATGSAALTGDGGVHARLDLLLKDVPRAPVSIAHRAALALALAAILRAGLAPASAAVLHPQPCKAEVRQAYRYNGHDAVELSVIADPEASSPRVVAAINAKLAEIEAAHPGIHVTSAYDNSRFVGQLTTNMVEELIVSVLLAGLVLLVFLEDLSATAIVMTSIPTCLGLALLLFWPMQFSINSSTLVGLLLAIGRLVDDSIVVIDSVHRKLDDGLPAARAAVEGTLAVILPIAAATGVMALAVVPLLMSGGITQIMFVGLVWPIVFALVASLVVSITITPLLAASLFRGSRSPSARWRTRLDDRVRYLLTPARRTLASLDAAYRRGLAWSLDHRYLVIGSAVLAIYLALQLLPFIGSEMMPLADTGQESAYLETEPGLSFAATDAKAKRFERILLAQPEVERVSGEIGEAPATGYVTGQAMNGVNSASYLITFSPKEERRRTIWQIMDAVYARSMRDISGVRRLALKEMGSDVMASKDAPVELLVYGRDQATLHTIADCVADIARTVPGMVQVATSTALTQPEERIVVDRTKAAQLGLAPADVQQQAYYATHGGFTNEYFNPSNVRHSQILVRYDARERANAGDLAYAQITGKDGTVVPLTSLARIERGVAPTIIEHDGLRPSVSILGYYRKGASGEMLLDMQTMVSALAQVPFPEGYGIAMRGDMTEMSQSFDRLLGAMKIAVLFIFLLLVAQFRSFVQPLVMLLAIPLELLGISAALLLAHQSLSTVSILGIVVASGMAVSNAILLIDLVVHKRAEGLTTRAAILAAGPVRLRPILMTTIVSLIVLVPVAFFPKTGIDAYAPLATVIIGGLSISTLLTLFVVPVLHDAFDDLAVWWKARRATSSDRPHPTLGAAGE